MSSCLSGLTSAILIGYKLKKKRLIVDLKLNGLNMKMFIKSEFYSKVVFYIFSR